jgi:hypothetical protein
VFVSVSVSMFVSGCVSVTVSLGLCVCVFTLCTQFSAYTLYIFRYRVVLSSA